MQRNPGRQVSPVRRNGCSRLGPKQPDSPLSYTPTTANFPLKAPSICPTSMRTAFTAAVVRSS
jgi:hypothetical protein